MWILIIGGYFRSAAIRHARLSRDSYGYERAIAYFFCSFTDQRSQEPQNIFGSFLVQLCEAHPKLWASVDERYRKKQAQSNQVPERLGIFELEDLITELSNELLTLTFFHLDAPNESKFSLRILQSLLKITERGSFLRIMISSTEDLGADLRSPLITFVVSDRSYITGDIEHYIEA